MTESPLPEPTNETLRALGVTGALPERQRVSVRGVQYDLPIWVAQELESLRVTEKAFRDAVTILHGELDRVGLLAQRHGHDCPTCRRIVNLAIAQRGCSYPVYVRGHQIPMEVIAAAALLQNWGMQQDLVDWQVLGIGPKDPG